MTEEASWTEASRSEETKRTAFIIGGTGQIGAAVTRRLAEHGWSVQVAHRGEHQGDETVAELDVTTVRLDRDDTDTLLETARGHDLVVDVTAYDTHHADQLAQLAGDVGSLVVISTGSVYLGRNGRYLDIATGPVDFPDFPVPLTEADAIIDNDEQTYSPLKAAMEQRLLETPDLPVSILRPGAIHGPYSPALREWFFIKRVLDGREAVVLSYDGQSRFSTTSTANLAELISLCADRPAARVLNAVDDEGYTVAEIGRTIADVMGHDLEIVTFPGPPRGDVGLTPWSVPSPIVQSMDAARAELGYRQPVSYADAVRHDIDWARFEVRAAEERDESWREVFPSIVSRYGADGWFPYEEEDAFLANS